MLIVLFFYKALEKALHQAESLTIFILVLFDNTEIRIDPFPNIVFTHLNQAGNSFNIHAVFCHGKSSFLCLFPFTFFPIMECKKPLTLQTIPLQVRASSLFMCVCTILAFYFCSSSHAMICLLFSYPITFRSVMKIGFSKSAKVTELMLLNLLASQRT